MKSYLKLGFFFGVQTALLTMLASLAFGAAEQPIGQLRQELGTRDPSTVQVNGRLICDLGTENTGSPCVLRLEEEGTGRVYRLGSANSAMRLYFDGVRRASIQGRMSSDASTIFVQSARQL